jgi:hypothetical protein
MHTRPAKAAAPAEEGEAEMHCNHSTGAPEPVKKCSANAQCKRTPQPMHAAPHMQGVLPAAMIFVTPGVMRTARPVIQNALIWAYASPPFHPPRLTA